MQHLTSGRITCTCTKCREKMLIKHFDAKSSEVAKPSDWMVSYTEHHLFILSPKGRNGRRVICQLSLRG